MYRANEYNMLKSSKGNVKIFEYEKGEWTYHAKGAWLYERDYPHPELPVMTVIGSSNYSARYIFPHLILADRTEETQNASCT